MVAVPVPVIDGVKVMLGVRVIDGVKVTVGVREAVLLGARVGNTEAVGLTRGLAVKENVAPGDVSKVCPVVALLAFGGAVGGAAPLTV